MFASRMAKVGVKFKCSTGSTINSRILVTVGFVLILFSLYLIGLSLWTFTLKRNGGLVAYLHFSGFGLKSPIPLGTVLTLAGCTGMANGVSLLQMKVSPSAADNSPENRPRNIFATHQMLSAGMIILLAVVLLLLIKPLMLLLNSGISVSTWERMAHTNPHDLCAYQVQMSCAGSTDFMCMKPSAQKTPDCPGNYCASVCALPPKHMERPNDTMCLACAHNHSPSELQKCKAIEARKTSHSCRGRLIHQVKQFLFWP